MRKYSATLPPHIWGMAGIVFYNLEYSCITIQIITGWRVGMDVTDHGQWYISTSFFEATGAIVTWKLDEIVVTVQIFSPKARMDAISFTTRKTFYTKKMYLCLVTHFRNPPPPPCTICPSYNAIVHKIWGGGAQSLILGEGERGKTWLWGNISGDSVA